MHTLRRVTIVMSLLATCTNASQAAWPNQPAVNLPVCRAANDQGATASVSDGAGGAIFAWQDNRNSFISDIYAQHVLASGIVDPAWPVDGRAICSALNAQTNPVIVTDGAGGAIIAWSDGRTPAFGIDVYAQHVLATGTVDPDWPVDGRALSTQIFSQTSPTAVSDGAGGAIVSWQDQRAVPYHIFAQRVLATGAVDPLWQADGRPLSAAAGSQYSPVSTTDGAGGAIVTWYDYRSGVSPDIYAQHVLVSGAIDPNYPVDGRAVCTQANDQLVPVIVADGAGGAIIAWQDLRNASNYDIWAQHLTSVGIPDPAWPVDGRALCLAVNGQVTPVIVTDGAGGAIVTWSDSRSGVNADIYAQHVAMNGVVDAGWPADGKAVCVATNLQSYIVAIPDGAGGEIVAWTDYRTNAGDIYAQHVLYSSGIDANYVTDGRALCLASSTQLATTMVADGSGGAIVAWQDQRSGTNGDIYAQRIARYGYLGTPEGELAGVRDIPNDNGGKVRVSWTASYLESEPYLASPKYNVFRSVPAHVAAQTIARGARLHSAPDDALRPGDLVRLPTAATTLFWELLTTVPAQSVPGYSYVAATTGDSLGAGNPKTLFMVQTRLEFTMNGTLVWSSPPDSGYSVDNIPPVTPAPFAANYAAGTAHLHWNRNTEADLANYRLYRGSSPSFTPSPATLIASPPDTGYADAASATYTYKLAAVDVHGNESPVATISPAAITGVDGGAVPRELALSPASPNPASSGTTLRFALPSSANVSLGIYDAAGRLVRALSSGALPAGEHAAAWDLRDAGGRIAGAGLYFARLDAGGRTLTRRIAVTP